MGLGPRFAQDIQIVPIMAPIDLASTTVRTTHLKVSNAHRVSLILQFGNLTSDSKIVTVEESSAASTTNAEAIAFMYRLSAKVGTADTWSAVTTADSDGVEVDDSSDDNKSLLIDIDPSALTEGDNYLAIKIVSSGGIALASAVALLVPRYPQLDQLSTT